MIKTLMFLSMFNSSIILISSHPISFGIILLLQTILISICSRMITHSSWIPLTIFLVMVGGLMILFLYITSICSNKKPHFMKPKFSQVSFFFISMGLIQNYQYFFLMDENMNLKDLHNMEFIKLFLPLNSFSSNFMFLYLLVMLIIMIEVMALNKGPMRKKY